jgi:hypothetical protein
MPSSESLNGQPNSDQQQQDRELLAIDSHRAEDTLQLDSMPTQNRISDLEAPEPSATDQQARRHVIHLRPIHAMSAESHNTTAAHIRPSTCMVAPSLSVTELSPELSLAVMDHRHSFREPGRAEIVSIVKFCQQGYAHVLGLEVLIVSSAPMLYGTLVFLAGNSMLIGTLTMVPAERPSVSSGLLIHLLKAVPTISVLQFIIMFYFHCYLPWNGSSAGLVTRFLFSIGWAVCALVYKDGKVLQVTVLGVGSAHCVAAIVSTCYKMVRSKLA